MSAGFAIPAEPRVLTGPVVQCAVNMSEGRREDVICEIAGAIMATSGAVLADCSADVDHNRMVATILGPADAVGDALLAAAEVAVRRIDLREHSGVHPRLGAVDVVPFTPIRQVTMAECLALSLRVADALAERLKIPVFLYERSARPGRNSALPDIRRGQFEGLAATTLTGMRAPDLGPDHVHPTAGAVVVGAREPLVACNIMLREPAPDVARQIAHEIRAARPTDPGFRGVRSLGFYLTSRGLSQVSLNLTNPEAVTLPGIFDRIAARAAEMGVPAVETELIGLAPAHCLAGRSPDTYLWRQARSGQVLDNWLPQV